MPDPVYTHGLWRVQPGHEEAFIAAWEALADVFASSTEGPFWGTLLRSTADTSVFYSFGPWRSQQDILLMRADPVAQQAIARIREHCREAIPEICELVRHVTT